MRALSLPWALWWDRRALTTRIHYEFDELGLQVQEGVVRLVKAFERAHGLWSVRIEDHHGDWKRNAGAGVSVDRQPVRVVWGAPARIETNVRVGGLIVSGTTLYLFPDRLLIYGAGGIHGVRYTDLEFEPETVRFSEEGRVPRDAVVVGKTWRFVNLDGGPDRRFNNNYQIPIVRYGVLTLSAHTGLRMRLHLSTDGLAEASAKLLGLVQEAIKDLESRGVPLRSASSPLRTDGDDLPPLAIPALKAAQVGLAALEYRWLNALPDWAVPIIWGLVFALPAVALMFIAVQGMTTTTGVLLAVALVLSGCGVPVLARDWQRMVAARRLREAQERRSQFRAVLISELRTISRVNFETLVADSGLARAEADSVADELYRLIADRVVADGVITSKEKRKLELLAATLRIAPDRVSRIDADAKSERNRRRHAK